MKIIQLTNPEALPEGIYAKNQATHARICNYHEEIKRIDQFKPRDGWFIVYLALCFKNDEGAYIEIPEWEGLEFKIEGEKYEILANVDTTTQPFSADVCQIIGQFLIDEGYIEGTLIDE